MTDDPNQTARESIEWRGYPDGEVPPRELMKRLTWDMMYRICGAVS